MTESHRREIEARILDASEITYKRAFWKHLYRWLAFVFLVGLDISMPMSMVERISRHHIISPLFEFAQFGFLFLVNAYMLPVCVFEVNCITIRGEELIVANLLWKEKLAKKTIVSLQMPKMLIYAILRTPRCFYLINKVDIPNFDELVSLIGQKYLR